MTVTQAVHAIESVGGRVRLKGDRIRCRIPDPTPEPVTEAVEVLRRHKPEALALLGRQSGPHPIGGVDYPRTLPEFNDWFSSEAACLAFLRRVRWRESFRCPQCAGSEAWLTNTGHLKCRKCRRRTSLTAGTIFERTQKPLRVWFQAMWYLTSQKSGGSALGLQQVLGLGQLPDSLELAPQAAACAGPAGPGSAQRLCGGG